jgi:hyperosmotically inducible periplasmic protein
MIPKIVAAFLSCCLLSVACLAADKPAITDDVIIDRVMIKFSQDPVVKAGDVKVDSKGGVVTLTGSVGTAKQKERATKLAAKVKGVKKVDNNLTIQEKNGGK